MLLDNVRPGREFNRKFLPPRGQPQRDDALVPWPRVSADQLLLLQGAHGITHRGPGEVELLGDLADPAKLDVVVEKIDEELGLDRAQVVLICLLPKQKTENL